MEKIKSDVMGSQSMTCELLRWELKKAPRMRGIAVVTQGQARTRCTKSGKRLVPRSGVKLQGGGSLAGEATEKQPMSLRPKESAR